MLSKFSFHVCLVNKPLDLGTSIVTKDLEMFGNVHVFALCNVGPIIYYFMTEDLLRTRNLALLDISISAVLI